MLEKTIRQVITKKISDWISSIKDPEVAKIVREDLIITGGCFTSMLQNESPKDFDCYFRTKQSAVKVAQYYVDIWNEDKAGQDNQLGIPCKVFVLDGGNPSKELLNFYGISSLGESKSRMIDNTPPERVKVIFPSDGIVGDPDAVRAPEELGLSAEEILTVMDETDAEKVIEKESRRYFPVFMSTNAITLSNGIQIVVRFYGEPDKIHETYDYEHTKAYFDMGKRTLSIPREVYELVMNKTLRYTGSRYPVCSAFRMRKFIERGWRINAGQILKIAMQISQLDLTNVDVLEDQLVGVDSIYFMNLINQFRRRQEKDATFHLTADYVMSVVDKIF